MSIEKVINDFLTSSLESIEPTIKSTFIIFILSLLSDLFYIKEIVNIQDTQRLGAAWEILSIGHYILFIIMLISGFSVLIFLIGKTLFLITSLVDSLKTESPKVENITHVLEPTSITKIKKDVYSSILKEITKIIENIQEAIDYDEGMGKLAHETITESDLYSLIPNDEEIKKQIEKFYDSLGIYHRLFKNAANSIVEVIYYEITEITEEKHDWESALGGSIRYSFNNFLKFSKPKNIPSLRENQFLVFFNMPTGYGYNITLDDLEKNGLRLEQFLSHLHDLINEEKAIIRLQEKRDEILTNGLNLKTNLRDKLKTK